MAITILSKEGGFCLKHLVDNKSRSGSIVDCVHKHIVNTPEGVHLGKHHLISTDPQLVTIKAETNARRLGQQVPASVRDFLLEKGWVAIGRIVRNGPAFRKEIPFTPPEYENIQGVITEIQSELQQVEALLEGDRIKTGHDKPVIIEKGDARIHFESTQFQGYGLVDIWKTGGGGHAARTWVKANSGATVVVNALKEHTQVGSSVDFEIVSDNHLIIYTHAPGIWIGTKGWRVKGLRKAVGGKVEIIKKL